MVMNRFKYILCLMGALLIGASANAQLGNTHTIKAVLLDESNGEPVPFATVSLTKKGETKPYKYVLSDSDGKVDTTDCAVAIAAIG